MFAFRRRSNDLYELTPHGKDSLRGSPYYKMCIRDRFVYKELNAKIIYEAIRETVLVNGQTTFLVGLSLAFARYLTMAQVPAAVADGILSISSPIIILLVINLFLLVVGCFIDNISSTVILTPILLPIVVGLGMDPVQFGIIMTVNLAIGFITPPYGANLFFASAVALSLIHI